MFDGRSARLQQFACSVDACVGQPGHRRSAGLLAEAADDDWDGISIADFEKSLTYDVSLIRNSPGTPKHIEIYGLFYDIDSGELTEVVRDVPAEVAS